MKLRCPLSYIRLFLVHIGREILRLSAVSIIQDSFPLVQESKDNVLFIELEKYYKYMDLCPHSSCLANA